MLARRGSIPALAISTTDKLPLAARQADRGPAVVLLEAIQTLVYKLGPPSARGTEALDNVR